MGCTLPGNFCGEIITGNVVAGCICCLKGYSILFLKVKFNRSYVAIERLLRILKVQYERQSL